MMLRNAVNDHHDHKKIIAALDVGTHKTTCLIARQVSQDRLQIIGQALYASRGIKNGVIHDMGMAASVMARTVQMAERVARGNGLMQPLDKIFMNVSAKDIFCYPSQSEIIIRGQAIQDNHIQKALQYCVPENPPKNGTPIHQINFGYLLDHEQDVANPTGMTAHIMKARLLEIAVPTRITDHLSNALSHAHLEVEAFCLSGYASALSCLVEDERDLGCTLIDIGAGMTHIAIFAEGRLIQALSIPVGSQHITNDIARGLTTSLQAAERLKTLHGHAIPSSADDIEMIDVPLVGEGGGFENRTQIPRSILIGIIQPRLEEIFEFVRARIDDSGLGHMAGRRVVLTGGGSMLPGIREMAQTILDKQVRLGKPAGVSGLNEETTLPAAATAVGLLKYGFEHEAEIPVRQSIYSARSVMGQIVGWIRENW